MYPLKVAENLGTSVPGSTEWQDCLLGTTPEREAKFMKSPHLPLDSNSREKCAKSGKVFFRGLRPKFVGKIRKI